MEVWTFLPKGFHGYWANARMDRIDKTDKIIMESLYFIELKIHGKQKFFSIKNLMDKNLFNQDKERTATSVLFSYRQLSNGKKGDTIKAWKRNTC